jgi:hypothetical protein
MELGRQLMVSTHPHRNIMSKRVEAYDAAYSQNLTVPHGAVTSLAIKADELVHRKRDFFIWMEMKRRKEIFQVYNFDMNYWENSGYAKGIRFYAVPLGVYFKPRRQTQTRENILHEYAMDTLEIFRRVLPAGVISP